MDLTEINSFGADKIARYGWTVQDAPGEMRMLHKSVLNIHPDYQRALIAQKVKEISATWSWIAVGALVVGERDGMYWVIDGQHRAAAAKRRSDISTLPCVVFQTESVKQEARGFLTIQTMRKPVTAVAKQKAMVTSGDEVATFVQNTLDSLDLKISTTSNGVGSIKCIAWCLRRAAEDRETFVKVLCLVAEISEKDGIGVAERVLDGLWVIHGKCGAGLDDKRLVKRIREKGAKALMLAANRACAYYARGGNAIWAKGILSELNKGLRASNSFTMDGMEA